MIVVGGMIGLGKTSVAKMIGEHFNTTVFYESVEENKILPLFYTASEKEIREKRYPFLLQLWFLDTRFRAIKQALVHDNNVLDRSIYEDWYFARKNMELGRISELEMELYDKILHNMMEELDEIPKKSPDLMVYLKGSFDTVLNRIKMRGRSYEMDESLEEYYRFLWDGYDDWVYNQYKASEILVIDTDNTDIVKNPEDRVRVLKEIDDKLLEIRNKK